MTTKRRRSPRERRLHSDFRAIDELANESSIFDFKSEKSGLDPERYTFCFHGKGLAKSPDGEIFVSEIHEVNVTLTSAYPRMIPELAWQTPIFHPNISAGGVVCLGGYGTHWVPSLRLNELCIMLWDMIRYRNFDIESPYNREAAIWAKNQNNFRLPVDGRPLRNRMSTPEVLTSPVAVKSPTISRTDSKPSLQSSISSGPVAAELVLPANTALSDVVFIDSGTDDRSESIKEDSDIMFID
ncbi:MAG: ubiquitin-conjugating enzyme E2 [Pirellulaceae bacterium]|nr:ubiquitin-conjugating enzyme E2 [Pirellulaceae bacterium]